MKSKIKYLFILLGFMLTFPLNANAECNYERQAELAKIASNVQLNYSYDINSTGHPYFIIHVTNATNDIYIVDDVGNEYKNKKDFDIIYNQTGETIRYDIYSNDYSCQDQKILSKYISLPQYNLFSTTRDCQGYPKFKYCQTWLDTENITQKQFNEEIEKYKQQFATDDYSSTVTTSNGILGFLKEHLLIVATLVIAVTVIIVIVAAKIRRRMKYAKI